jgi:hypothetical protein
MVVESMTRKRVRIESFSRLEILQWRCRRPGDGREGTRAVFDHPLSATLRPGAVEIEAATSRRSRTPGVHVVPVDEGRAWARISERSPSRVLTVVGVAAAAGVAAFGGTYPLVRAKQSNNGADLDVLRPLLLGNLAAALGRGNFAGHHSARDPQPGHVVEHPHGRASSP